MAPLAAWGAAHGDGAAMTAVGTTEYAPNDQAGCFLFDPGSGGSWNVGLTGNGRLTQAHTSANDIGI